MAMKAKHDMNFTAKRKTDQTFTIGFWIWMTIIVGKKWNIENIELLQMHAYIKVLDVK